MKYRRIQAVFFDFDGTLTRPGALDFKRIKSELGCPDHMPLLEFITGISDPDQRGQALLSLEAFEMDAAAVSEPNAGAEETIRFLKKKDIRIGIITRNRLQSVERALENFRSITLSDFQVIISRDDPVPPKPDPDCIRAAARKLGLISEETMVVGDFVFDIEAGNRAGAVSVFLTNGSPPAESQSDHMISSLNELRNLVRLYTPLPAGKFPNDLLGEYLNGFDFQDPSVIIRPGIGEDIAAVDISTEEILILKSDPITFATDAIAHYAVLVNANDIATSGAVPRWLLTTLMFPCGTIPSQIFRVLGDLESVCCQWGITLCGGHTEITDAVNRPVITGMLAGTVRRDNLIDKRNMAAGDMVLLTKGVSVEGTSIIAREFGDRLKDLGMEESQIEICRQFLSQISILDEARISAENHLASAMHDVTEGGLATALEELSTAGGCRIRVFMENIPILPQTQIVCDLLDINPLGLIGSGSLLICCRKEHCRELITRMYHAGIQTTVIGEVLEPGQGIEAMAEGRPLPWPRFEVDEITKLF
jgi:HAD superfamily hydrolase (TIGR01509 family)